MWGRHKKKLPNSDGFTGKFYQVVKKSVMPGSRRFFYFGDGRSKGIIFKY